MISKKRRIANIMSCLKQIASSEFQEKGWVKIEVHDYCSFAETLSKLFDDDYFEDFIDNEAKEFGLTDRQIKKLDQLRNSINAYVDKHGCYREPELIVKDPEWIKVRQLAKEALEVFHISNYLDPSKTIPKESLLSLISCFVSPIFQKRVWIEQRRPNKNPFREWMNDFFYSTAYKTNEIIEHFQDYDITEEQQKYLVKLYDTLKLYWEKKKDVEDLNEILQDPEWHQIQDLSAEVLKVLGWNDPADD